MKTPAERFWPKVDTAGGPDGCWPWIAYVKPNGYGQFAPDGQRRGYYAHRFAWELAYGAIPDGLTVDHLCRNRACQNVRHMELVTSVENYLRAVASWTHCRNGLHPMSESRYRIDAGCRICLPCDRASRAVSGQRRKARDLGARGGVDRRRKLTDEQRVAIRAEVSGGARRVDVAARYGVSAGHVDRIYNGRRPDRAVAASFAEADAAGVES